jgi:hypothetical protein
MPAITAIPVEPGHPDRMVQAALVVRAKDTPLSPSLKRIACLVHNSPLQIHFRVVYRRPLSLFLQFMDLFVHTPFMKGFFPQLRQGQNCHDGPTNDRGINNQGRDRHLEIPCEKLEIQRHTVLYGGNDNNQKQ